jgi:hypothetical protein
MGCLRKSAQAIDAQALFFQPEYERRQQLRTGDFQEPLDTLIDKRTQERVISGIVDVFYRV